MIYMRNDRLESPIILQKSEEHALERLASNLGKCVTALEALNDSLALHSHIGDDSIWRFKHPTIGDAYAAILAQNPELLGIFLQGSAPEKLIEQVTCGDVGIEKTVVIPKPLFAEVLIKLHNFTTSTDYKSKGFSTWDAKSKLQRFLARRCSKTFLSLYIEKNPDLLDKVSRPGLYLSAVSEVALAVRSHEFGLLPEEKRKKFIATVSEYTVQGEDLYALDNPRMRSVFQENEFEDLLRNVRIQLLPRLNEVRLQVESDHRSSEPPDEHMQRLLESFEILKRIFKDIEQETRLANEWIAETENAFEEPDTKPRTLGEVETIEKTLGTRSIFDDIDT